MVFSCFLYDHNWFSEVITVVYFLCCDYQASERYHFSIMFLTKLTNIFKFHSYTLHHISIKINLNSHKQFYLYHL